MAKITMIQKWRLEVQFKVSILNGADRPKQADTTIAEGANAIRLTIPVS